MRIHLCVASVILRASYSNVLQILNTRLHSREAHMQEGGYTPSLLFFVNIISPDGRHDGECHACVARPR